MIISRSVIVKMRNVSDEGCRENENTRFVFNSFFFLLEIRAVYGIMWKNIVGTGRPHDNTAHALCMLYT
jgi:hypothetical protein